MAGPADRDGRRAEGVLEDEIPADDPRDELAERRVPVSVRGAGDRHRGRELRVAQAGKGARESREQHRQHDRRTGVLRRRLARQHENAGPDDGADAERYQVDRPEDALERMPTCLGRFGLQLLDRLRGKNRHRHQHILSGRNGWCRGLYMVARLKASRSRADLLGERSQVRADAPRRVACR